MPESHRDVEIWEGGRVVRAPLMEVIWAEESLGSGRHFHGEQGETIKTDERQTTGSIYIYGPKRGKREVMPREKGEDTKERFDKEKTFNSAKDRKNRSQSLEVLPHIVNLLTGLPKS